MTAMRPSFAACLAALLACSAARAQDPTAEQLIEQGVERRRAGDEVGALELFRKAYELEPSPRAQGQMGLAAKSLRLWVEAERHLQGALATSSDPWVEKNREALGQALELVANNLGSLRVESNAPNAKLFVNGRELADLPMSEPVRVVAGSTELELRAPGFQTEFRRETLPAKRVTTLRIELERDAPAPPLAATVAPAPAAPPPPAPDRGATAASDSQRTWAYVAGGVGVVGIGVGTYFGLRTLSLKNERDEVCPEAECSSQRGVDLDDRARSAALVSTVSFGVGVLALGAGAVLWLTAPDTTETGPAVGASLGPTDARATLRLRF